MNRFKIYPKKGDEFIATFDHFSLEDENLVIFTDSNHFTKDAYISVENVAAIVAENHQQTTRCFQVHLRNRPDPLPIYADNFEVNYPAVDFYLKPPETLEDILQFPMPVTPTRNLVEGVYVALSEVIAIIPVTA